MTILEALTWYANPENYKKPPPELSLDDLNIMIEPPSLVELDGGARAIDATNTYNEVMEQFKLELRSIELSM